MTEYAQALRLDAGPGARPLGRRDRDRRATSARGEVFDKALAEFAERYADQNERDYAALKEAVDSGRVAAETGL